MRREDLTKAAGEILRSVLIRSFSREDLIGQPNDDLLSQESGHLPAVCLSTLKMSVDGSNVGW